MISILKQLVTPVDRYHIIERGATGGTVTLANRVFDVTTFQVGAWEHRTRFFHPVDIATGPLGADAGDVIGLAPQQSAFG
jgi:hypothetical protein